MGSRMPCSVPVHPWERSMAAQGGTGVEADHQKADDAAVPTELWHRFPCFTLKEQLRWDFSTPSPPRLAGPRPPLRRAKVPMYGGDEEDCSKTSGDGAGQITLYARTQEVSPGSPTGQRGTCGEPVEGEGPGPGTVEGAVSGGKTPQAASHPWVGSSISCR